MKIIKSPFSHKIICPCSCELHYKDSDIISKVVDDEKRNIIYLSTNVPLLELLKKECSSKENSLLDEPNVELHVYFKYVKHYFKCPFCNLEVQIRPVDKDKHEIFWESIITGMKLYVGTTGKSERLYMWYYKRIQWFIDNNLLPKDFSKPL